MRILLLCTAVSLALLAGCGSTDPESKCGDRVHWNKDLYTPAYTSVTNGIRTMIYAATDEPEDLCSEEHAKPFFQVYPVSAMIAGDITLTASAQIPLKQPNHKSMPYDGVSSTYDTEIEVGLAQAYSNRPGYISMQVIAEFPSRGDYQADSTYIVKNIESIYMSLDYFKYKP